MIAVFRLTLEPYTPLLSSRRVEEPAGGIRRMCFDVFIRRNTPSVYFDLPFKRFNKIDNFVSCHRIWGFRWRTAAQKARCRGRLSGVFLPLLDGGQHGAN